VGRQKEQSVKKNLKCRENPLKRAMVGELKKKNSELRGTAGRTKLTSRTGNETRGQNGNKRPMRGERNWGGKATQNGRRARGLRGWGRKIEGGIKKWYRGVGV